jgi:proteasome assembly chaperone (PAC2) family protein
LKIELIKKIELNPDEIKDSIVLIGWPGIALVAKLAVSSIKDSVKAEEFLNIISYDFPPKSNVEKGDLEIPMAKVYYKANDQKGAYDFFFLTANYQPQTSTGVFEFSQLFCEEMKKITHNKVKMYVSTGALVTERINDPPNVHICGTDENLVKTFLKIKNTKLMETGVIAGANGILPAWAGAKGFAPGVCLLAETLPLPMMSLDPRSSKALVSLIKEYFNIKMDFEELDKKIEEMEEVVEKYKQQAEHLMRGVEEDKGTDSYFR